MFKKILIPALVVAASAAALPAAAQSYGGNHGYQNHGPAANAGYGNWQSINARQVNLDRRIDQGVRNGSLSRREAVRLRGEFSGLVRLEANYRRGGLSGWERADLDRRFDRLSASIRAERWDRNDHQGRDDRRDRYDHRS